ncbi:hypothetical protein AXG93_3457s1400 [Marchantia polymorpha subsp. ruderalis]|uniref:Uncharacterized protein n=3 Tax=Marchantia polymorpha TaxID=3197 RepID=A0A176W0S7_MARPO|nr:hypothetical protein AXG93_3457s1400 [Marchantia polymorpha subsp. ruderalis]
MLNSSITPATALACQRWEADGGKRTPNWPKLLTIWHHGEGRLAVAPAPAPPPPAAEHSALGSRTRRLRRLASGIRRLTARVATMREVDAHVEKSERESARPAVDDDAGREGGRDGAGREEGSNHVQSFASARVEDADVVRGVALDSDPSVIQIEVEASSYFSRPPEEMGRGRIPNTQGFAASHRNQDEVDVAEPWHQYSLGDWNLGDITDSIDVEVLDLATTYVETLVSIDIRLSCSIRTCAEEVLSVSAKTIAEESKLCVRFRFSPKIKSGRAPSTQITTALGFFFELWNQKTPVDRASSARSLSSASTFARVLVLRREAMEGKVGTGDFFAKTDAYRKHPMLNNNLRRATPGLGIAIVLFGGYLFVDGMRAKLSKKSEH